MSTLDATTLDSTTLRSTTPAAINFKQLPNSIHPIPSGSKIVRRTNPYKRIRVLLAVKPVAPLPDLSSLDNLNPTQRTYMTREDLAKHYGSDPASVKRIEAFAAAHNLIVTKNNVASARMGLEGTVADLSTAFGVTLNDYTHPTLGAFHARTGPVQVPAEVAGDIVSVFGFNNHRILQRKSRTADIAPDMTAAARPWFKPNELAPIYNFPTSDASKQCVGLLEFGGGVETADVTTYFQALGLPAPNVVVVPVDGVSTNPAADPDSTGEVMLDIDVAGALSGGAKLAVYFSTFDEKGLVDCLSKVIEDSHNDPAVLSMSWGWAENEPFNSSGITWSPAAIQACDQSFLASAHLGITVCVSTGDDGSEAQIEDGRAHVNYPAVSPYVLAVGGTTLHLSTDASGATHRSEITWNGGPQDGATGGGVSEIVAIPPWQQNIDQPSVNAGHHKGRAIPDVAANADPATGYLMRSGGKNQVVGGTSASSPLWASLITRINAKTGARAGNFNALLYSKIGPQKVLNDITAGDNDITGQLNGAYPAKVGWDACTGWGSPNGALLETAL